METPLHKQRRLCRFLWNGRIRLYFHKTHAAVKRDSVCQKNSGIQPDRRIAKISHSCNRCLKQRAPNTIAPDGRQNKKSPDFGNSRFDWMCHYTSDWSSCNPGNPSNAIRRHELRCNFVNRPLQPFGTIVRGRVFGLVRKGVIQPLHVATHHVSEDLDIIRSCHFADVRLGQGETFCTNIPFRDRPPSPTGQ